MKYALPALTKEIPMTTHQRLPIVLRDLEVLEVRDLAPRMRRISLGGPQLQAFTVEAGDQPAFQSLGADDHIKIFLPDPETGVMALPRQGPGRLFWPEDPHALSREYTPRGYDPESGRLDLDFVLHGHGPAGLWAAQAKPGDRLHVAGPRASMLMPDAAHHVLFGDETALPALANWIEMAAPDQQLHLFVQCTDPDMQALLPSRPNAHVTWLEALPNTAEGFAALIDPLGFGPEAFYWGGAERQPMAALRSLLKDRDWPAQNYDTGAYWTMGEASDEH